jgi:hypothetical protein
MGDQNLLIYYLELLRASEGTLSRWSRLHLQSLCPLQFQGGLTSGRRPVVKINAESLSQHVVPTPLSRIRVGRRCFIQSMKLVTYSFSLYTPVLLIRQMSADYSNRNARAGRLRLVAYFEYFR